MPAAGGRPPSTAASASSRGLRPRRRSSTACLPSSHLCGAQCAPTRPLLSCSRCLTQVAKKNPRKFPKKLEFRKYDPRVRQHVMFTETKLK